ncbi:glycosyltransferase family 29 protein [Methylobrevis albus]|uniref:Uncharacterized protein n=1 Tax=Methylobrevis albus TaxID=2793297 RepID=A0A931N0T6_9HYPH|nr:hypothetical protein [Methylobrevis albus]MBH0239574.1 hypothetical protein [Methylobrevis albus]
MSIEANESRSSPDSKSPGDVEIAAVHARAVEAFGRKDWPAAAALFDEVDQWVAAKKPGARKGPKGELKAYRFLRAAAQTRARLDAVAPEERARFLAGQAKLVQPGNFNPEDLAGLAETLDILASDPAYAPFLDRDALASAMAALSTRVAKIDGKLVTAGGAPRFRPAVLKAVRDALSRLPEAPPITTIAPAHWLVISYILILALDPSLGHWARGQALQAALDDSCPVDSRAAIRLKASAHAEVGDGEGLDRVVAAHPVVAKDMRFIRVYLARERPQPGPLLPGTEEISAFIRGHSVAMVGPANTGLANGAEIDGFDAVVRMNYRGLDGFPPEVFGTRTDISYYVNGLLSKEYERTLAVLDDLRFAIIPMGRKIEGVKRVKFPPNLIAGRKDTPFFAGTPNAFQRYIFDLFHYGASRIKIFNGNMWLDRNPTNPAYHKGHFLNFNLPFVFIRHDIVSNFVFLKRMLERGYIEVDAVLHDILSMDVEHYVREMIATHGTPPPGNAS